MEWATVNELGIMIKHSCYRRYDYNGGEVLVCNLCGNTYLSFQDVMEHILEFHADEQIPDVDPTI